MALDVIKMFTKYNHDVINNKKNDWIVIHWVGSKSSAIDNGKYFANGERGASAHYFVDDDNVVQSVREGHVAYAVGSNGYLDQALMLAKVISIMANVQTGIAYQLRCVAARTRMESCT